MLGTANQITATPDVGTVTIALATNPQLPGTGSVALPGGTTAQQAGIAGSIRFNSQTSVFESTVDGVVWATIETSATGVISIIGTANQIHVSSATGNVTISLVDNAVLPGTGGVTLPSGNTAARGAVAGSIRFNSQTNVVELTNDGSNWYTVETSASGVTSVSGTTNRITSTGGTTPVIDISASYVGQSSITTLGTISTGVWNGTAITVPNGGTGDTSLTAYSVLCGGTSSTSAIQSVASLGTSAQVLTSNGAAALPTWQDAAGASGAAKFWIKCNEAGTISASFNVTSATDNGTGMITIAFTSNFATANWCGNACGFINGGVLTYSSQNAGNCQVICLNSTTQAAVDPTFYYISGFGT